MLTFFKNKIVSMAIRLVHSILNDENIRNRLWKISNVRPGGKDCSFALVPNSIEEESFRLATRQTAQYVDDNMPHLYGIPNPLDLLKFAINKTQKNGLFLEFGVYSGLTINLIASQTDRIVHGFDSFKGLPEQWGSVPAGAFTTGGKLPKVLDNVKLHVGLFEDTLPKFIKKYKENVSFLHIDSDLYSSAKTVLFSLESRIVPGTIIVFDEYFNYPGWKLHEFKAFQEFIRAFDRKYEYIGFSSKGFSVAVKIL